MVAAWRFDMRLQDKLDAFTANAVEKGLISQPILAKFVKGTKDLIESGQAERALKAGDKAPLFNLPDADGVIFNARSLLAKRPLVVTFYRGVWCPYCNMDLQALEAARPGIESRGASLVALSMQNASNSRKSTRDNHLGFPILVDFKGLVADQFGLRFKLPDELVEVYKQFGNDLPQINGEPSWMLPMPARYVIDQDGVVAYAEVNPDYTKRPDPSELLPVLDSLKVGRAVA
jgi:peroxiredoxin